jgi:hypothetical protein
MNGITFNRGQGGLGRRLAGEDHVSGLILRGANAESIIELRNVADAEEADITAAQMPEAHYYVSEFFRLAPGARLFLSVIGEDDTPAMAVKLLQQAAAGAVRQACVIDKTIDANTIDAEAKAINDACEELALNNMPVSAIVQLMFDAADMATLPDLHTVNAPRVSVCIAADGGGYGKYLAELETPVVVGGAATLLGTVAKSRVSDSPAWVEKYNVVTTAYNKSLTGGDWKAKEFDAIALSDGTPVDKLTPAQLQSLDEKGYIFLRKQVGVSGSFWNDGYTATPLDSDYAYIENNRAIDKACREVYKALLPNISGPAYIDPDSGNLSQETITSLEELANVALDQMVRDKEISGGQTIINPAQNVLGTSNLAITVDLVPVGVLRHIIVTIGFKLKLE